MNINDLLEKEFYIVDCQDFIYFARPVHIIGIGGSSDGYERYFILDIKDFMNRDRKMYMYELERYKTFEEAEQEAKRLNNIPSNKKRAKQWNMKDKFIAMGGRL